MNTARPGTPPPAYRGAKACVLLFVLSAMISFGYVALTGTYNGDFFGVEETLGLFRQAVMLVLGLAPYAVGWLLYRHYKAKPYAGVIPVPDRRLTATFFVIVAWFIFLAAKYDVGVLTKGDYDAPALIKPFIQVSNRINPFYLGVMFILGHRGSRRVLAAGVLSLIALGILRAGLGVFLYILLAFIIRDYARCAEFIRRRKTVVLAVALAAPLVVSQLYALRSSLREVDSELEFTATQVITARLVGRLSSFSNSSLTLQESPHFESIADQLDPLYFERQMFGGIFGIVFLPTVTPERMLINVFGGDFMDVSFMVGLPGNLYLAWLKSPVIAVVNAALVVLVCAATFRLARLMRMRHANEFALMLLLYPLTSGVGNEFSSLMIAVASFCVLFALLAIPWRPPVRADAAC